jgi:hypothetical protein
MITAPISDSISSAILNQDDPELVREGAPAYMLLIEGMINENPENISLLIGGAKLFGAYSTVFAADKTRARLMANKALNFSERAICLKEKAFCNASSMSYKQIKPLIAKLNKRDLEVLYIFATSWAGVIQLNTDSWKYIGQLAQVQLLLEKVVALDDSYERGQPHIYLGVLHSQIPPAQGGNPERGREHFERAIELSNGRDLMAKVMYAENYARLMYDQELHDRLLDEVLKADPHEPGLTLTNVIAQQQARELQASAKEYF